MRILYDHQAFAFQKYGGITRYFAELIAGLRNKGQEAVWPEGMYGDNQYLTESAGFTAHPLQIPDIPGKKLLQYYLGRQKSRKAWQANCPDIFHPTYFDSYFLPEIKKRGIPVVVTVHDMIHEILGNSTSRFSIDAGVVKGKKLICEQADAIVCVSQNTKNNLLEIYPHLAEKEIRVIWHGNSLEPVLPYTHKLSLPGQYILFTGNRKGYKNFAFFVKAIAPLFQKHRDLFLVCAGAGAFTEQEKNTLETLGISNRTVHIPFHTNDQIAEIYQRALCFIFPSQYEGFGIPVLEAFACGTPAILNKNSSLIEIGEDAALYFTDGDANSLQKATEALLSQPAMREELVRKGKERLKLFSWKKSVEAHLALYQSLQ